MSKFSRRRILASTIPAAAIASLSRASWSLPPAPAARKGRIRQSVSRWCYDKIPLDKLCAAAADMGLQAIDLLEVSDFEVPRRYGLVCSMGYAGGGKIESAMNRVENH